MCFDEKKDNAPKAPRAMVGAHKTSVSSERPFDKFTTAMSIKSAD